MCESSVTISSWSNKSRSNSSTNTNIQVRFRMNCLCYFLWAVWFVTLNKQGMIFTMWMKQVTANALNLQYQFKLSSFSSILSLYLVVCEPTSYTLLPIHCRYRYVNITFCNTARICLFKKIKHNVRVCMPFDECVCVCQQEREKNESKISECKNQWEYRKRPVTNKTISNYCKVDGCFRFSSYDIKCHVWFVHFHAVPLFV